MRSLYRGSLVGGAMTGHCCSSGCASYVVEMEAEAHSSGADGRADETRCNAPLALDPHSLTSGPFKMNFRWNVVARWKDNLRRQSLCRGIGRRSGDNASNSVAAMTDNETSDFDDESDDSTALSDAQEALENARRRIAEAPAQVVIINHMMGLYELAAIHLSSVPPKLSEASLAIDALAALVEKLGDRLGDDVATMRDALANIQMVYVQMNSRN